MIDLRVDDLAASHARIAMLGGRPGDPQDAPTGRYVTFLDPDGYRVQVFEKKR
jgi:predicted enzyme related to lactoylglutathione lyase